jgi:hypothetical protein
MFWTQTWKCRTQLQIDLLSEPWESLWTLASLCMNLQSRSAAEILPLRIEKVIVQVCFKLTSLSLLQIHKWSINTATTLESGLQNSNQCSHVDIYMATPSNPLANRYTITMSKFARREKWRVLVLVKEESNEARRPTRWRTKPLPKCQCLKIVGEP